MRTYGISMGVRTLCVLAAVLSFPHWWAWLFVPGAVVLPYVAVVLANVGGERVPVAPAPVALPPTSLPVLRRGGRRLTGRARRHARARPGGASMSPVLTAFVLITTTADRIPEVAQQVADIPGVSEVYSVTGDVNLVAVARVQQHDELADVIADRLSKVGGRRGDEHHDRVPLLRPAGPGRGLRARGRVGLRRGRPPRARPPGA